MFDPSHYPRRYAAGKVAKTMWTILTLCALGGVAGAVWAAARVSPWPVAAALLGMTVMMAAGSVWTTLGKFHNWLVLYPDRLEYRDLRSRATIHRSDIVESFGGGREDGRFHLSLNLMSGQTVTIHSYARGDLLFAEWFNDFPNLEHQEALRLQDTVRGNAAFGADPDRRLDAYRVWQRCLLFAALVAGVVVFWALIFPYPYTFVLGYLIIVPVIAVCVAAIWRRKLTLMMDDRAGRVSIGPLVYFPIMGLAWRGFMDANLVQPLDAAPVICAAAVAVTLLGSLIDGRLTIAGAAWGFIAALGWCAGAGTILNVQLDRGQGTVHVVKLLENDTFGTTLRLQPAKWPGGPSGRYYAVGSSVFYSTRPGDPVCVHVRPGALGWAHADLRKCPPTATGPGGAGSRGA